MTMIKFTKPQELNGNQLRKELRNGQVPISDDIFSVQVDDNDELWLDIAEKDKTKAAAIVQAHVGIDESIAKKAAKTALLAKLGITAEEAALLLQ